MDYPYITSKEYFSPSEKKHIDDFLSYGFEVGHIYKNSNGDERFITRLAFPSGLITKQTEYAPTNDEGVFRYHTPLANWPGKVGRVWFREIKDNVQLEHGGCNSDEWLEWLGGTFVAREKPPEPENPADVRRYEQMKKKYIKEQQRKETETKTEAEVEKRIVERGGKEKKDK